jgi:hypothetical protein
VSFTASLPTILYDELDTLFGSKVQDSGAITAGGGI